MADIYSPDLRIEALDRAVRISLASREDDGGPEVVARANLFLDFLTQH